MQTQKQELEIDKMIIALVNHDWHQQFSEDIKSVAIKKGERPICYREESANHITNCYATTSKEGQ